MSWCIECNKSRTKTPEAARKYLLEKRFDLTIEQYENMLNSQGGVCKICKNPETKKLKGTLRSLSVDHRHRTGKVRGILCDSCNNGLGRFKDDPSLMIEAAKYISRFLAECEPG